MGRLTTQCLRRCGRHAVALAFVLGVASSVQAEIYKWVDENGTTHYSETAPEDAQSGAAESGVREISNEVDGRGNFTEFTDTRPIEYFQPERKEKPARVDVRIETFAFELSKAQRQRIDHKVRGLYQAYVRWFGWPAQPRQPITIKIFGEYDLFEQYQIDSRGRLITNRSHYSQSHREILMLGSNFADQTLGVLMHEVSHAVLDMQVPRSSKWFNEGLASMFEGLEWRNNNLQLGTAGGRSVTMKHKMREGSLLPAAHYLDIRDSAWGSESGRVENMYYMIAWSLMRFLVSTDHGREALAVSLRRQRYFSDQPGELAGMLDEVYPGGVQRLDIDWRHWITGL